MSIVSADTGFNCIAVVLVVLATFFTLTRRLNAMAVIFFSAAAACLLRA